MRTLDVYRYGHLTGKLREDNGAVEFAYEPADAKLSLRPISASLPLEPRIHQGAVVTNFFDNLLPEGTARDTLALHYKVSADDMVGMLRAIGAECAGALAIVDEGDEVLAEDAPFGDRYDLIKDDYELGQFIDALRTAPNAAFKGVPTRLSLAGAQSKTGIATFGDGKIYRPKVGAATTHILKFGEPPGAERFEDLIFNEYFCSRLARACDVPIRDVDLLPYRTHREGAPLYAFCIERYDRHRHPRYHLGEPQHHVTRLYQEDFCQALGRHRSAKYEEQGGISLSEMFAFCSDPQQIVFPVITRRNLLILILFNFIIGNRDSHAKNYSLLPSGMKAELAPAYDLVCTQFYGEKIDSKLPQQVGGAWRFEDVGGAQLDALAEEIKVQPAAVRTVIRALSKRLLAAMPRVIRQLQREPHAEASMPVAEKISEIVRGNIEQLLRVLG